MPQGFLPVFDEKSEVLILGSFPSVKSREIDFYYGNPQNRFWRMLKNVFQAEIGESVLEKKKFLSERHIALWDVVLSCEIQGSKDESILVTEYADLDGLIKRTNITTVLCNGARAYQEAMKEFPHFSSIFFKMPSTSPRNVFYREEVWSEAFHSAFSREKREEK